MKSLHFLELKMPVNKYPDLSNNKILKKLLEYPLFGILVYWALQGLLYMDWTERLFKLCLDAILTIVFAISIGDKVIFPWNWTLAVVIAHTLNFIFNAHLWAFLKHYGLMSNPREKYYKYSEKLFKRISSQRFIIYAAVYGSWARGDWSPSSDLDVRIVHAGLVSGLEACVFVLIERTKALFNHFPLDIYILDGFSRVARMQRTESSETILDRRIAE
jgi:predicted nucleotidyltransferase